MTIQRINQIESGKDKLLEQFKGKPNAEGVLVAHLEQSQSTQSAYEEMLDERSIFVAVGVQLDNIGKLVGEERLGRNDDDYRTAIFTRIAINVSSGTIPEITSIIKSYTGATSVRVFEHFPASVYIYVFEGTVPTDLLDIVDTLLPAGVGLGYLLYDDNPLSFTPHDEGDPNAEAAWLPHSFDFPDAGVYNLIDDTGDEIVDDVGDNIILIGSTGAEEPIIHGIFAETL